MSSRAVCPRTKDVCIEGCWRHCLKSVKPKPHLQFVLGEWRATVGIHGAIGVSPADAYRTLMAYLQIVVL